MHYVSKLQLSLLLVYPLLPFLIAPSSLERTESIQMLSCMIKINEFLDIKHDPF